MGFVQTLKIKGLDLLSAPFKTAGRTLDLVNGKTKQLNATLAVSRQRFGSLNRTLASTGRGLKNVGRGFSTFVTLPILGLGAAFVKAASDAEETESKFNTVFSGIAADAGAAANELTKNFGQSRLASKQLLSDTGDLLTGFGFSQESALKLSTEVQKLAIDLASFTNFSGGAEGASRSLTKALLGERESIKSLGISILEEDVKKQVSINSSKGLTFETLRQAKAFATLQLAQKQSKNAIGDFARTSQSFANQFRIMKSRVSDVAVEFGKVLLPAATKLVKSLKGMLIFFQNLSPAAKKIIIVIAGVAAAIGPLVLILGVVVAAIPAVITGFVAIAGITAPVALGIAGVATAVGALMVAGIFLANNWKDISRVMQQVWDGPIGAIAKFIPLVGIVRFAINNIGSAVAFLKNLFESLFETIFFGFGKTGTLTGNIADALSDFALGQGAVANFLGFGAPEQAANVGARPAAAQAAAGPIQRTNFGAQIDVNIPNAPKGTRVTAVPIGPTELNTGITGVPQ